MTVNPDVQFAFPAGFRRPVVIFGPISDVVNEKLANDLPNEFVIASKYRLNFLTPVRTGASCPNKIQLGCFKDVNYN